jgi:hypothetical protein
LERFDPEAEAIRKDDLKFNEYLISVAILHDRTSRLYKKARGDSSFASGTKKTEAGAQPPESGEEEARKTILASDQD